MRIDYKTRLDLDTVQWLKLHSAATGRAQTDIVNEAIEQYQASLAPAKEPEGPFPGTQYVTAEPSGDQAAFTPPVPPRDAPDSPPEPPRVLASFSGVAEGESIDQQIERLTQARDTVDKRLPKLPAAERRAEFERLDEQIRTLTAEKLRQEYS